MRHSCPMTSNHYTLPADARQGRCELYIHNGMETIQFRCHALINTPMKLKVAYNAGNI